MKYLVLLYSVFFISSLFPSNTNAFTFDIWASKASLKEVTDIALANGIKLQDSGITYGQPTLFVSKKYKAQLMRYPAEIHLIFTAESLQLCRIYIAWSNHDQKIIHQAHLYMLFDELKMVFSEKYQNVRDSIHHDFVETTSLCNNSIKSGYLHRITINDQDKQSIQLSHSRPCNWISIEYRDNSLYESQLDDIKKNKSEIEKDRSKF